MAETTPTLLTIPELAALTKTKPSYWYEQSRRGEIPGQRKVGKKFVRIDQEQFLASLKTGAVPA